MGLSAGSYIGTVKPVVQPGVTTGIFDLKQQHFYAEAQQWFGTEGPDLRLTINNPDSGGGSGSSFTLRLAGGLQNYNINWGDGNTESSTSNTLAHTYTTAGTYVIEVTTNAARRMLQPYFNNVTADVQQIIKVEIGGRLFVFSIDQAFRGASNMTEIDIPLGSSFTPQNCQNLFMSCSSLVAVPEFNSVRAQDFNSLCRDCTSLKYMPNLDTFFATGVSNAWTGCTSLETFPLLDLSSVLTADSAWRNCTSLTEFPPIDLPACTAMSATWNNCSSLTSFPLIDISSAQSIGAAWIGCTSLTSFPNLDVSSVTACNGTWNGCTSLVTFPQLNFSSSLTNCNNAWVNCALSATSIENILKSLDTSGAQNLTTNLAGGTNAKYEDWTNDAKQYFENLSGDPNDASSTGKGWTISYNIGNTYATNP